MYDSFNREINYLRISVIDRCNLRCVYCMPAEGVKLVAHDDILSFEEIAAVVREAVVLGFKKFRLTGGEPLVRRNIVQLVAMIADIAGVEDLAMTTNGVLLAQYANDLVTAGLKRVNVSLDTLDAKKFAALTRGSEDDFRRVLAGIAAAQEAGLVPIKINCVIDTITPDLSCDACMVREYAEKNKLKVRFIRRMDFARGKFYKIYGGIAGDCKLCNRIRLLSNGEILPCLFSDKTYAVRKLGAREALLQAIQHKPERGRACHGKWMCSVGG